MCVMQEKLSTRRGPKFGIIAQTPVPNCYHAFPWHIRGVCRRPPPRDTMVGRNRRMNDETLVDIYDRFSC